MATSEKDLPGRTAIVWFRRDLRLSDHPALWAALSRFDRVVPLFIWDPVLTAASGRNRLAFLAGCVEALDRSTGGRLVVRSGDPVRMMPGLAAQADASTVFVTADFGPYGSARDQSVTAALRPAGVELCAVGSPYAVAPGTLLTQGGGPFQVFTPFARAWSNHLAERVERPGRRPPLERLDRAGLDGSAAPRVVEAAASSATSGAGAPALPAPGEEAAHKRLDSFLARHSTRYRDERDRPDLDTTSRLSPYLRFGCLHPRQILPRLKPGEPGCDTFRTELCWREFYADVLFHRPDAARRSYRPEWRHFPVDEGTDADERFAAWAEGRTGYPIVDAGMRQLLSEGWMHNRVRMIVASFLVKDLHIDWVRGARWFMRHLVDGDLASNHLNWQWVAGSGTDAAPYYRVFNPVTQGKRFDPHGDYIRRWIPELAAVPAAAVHEPWKAPDSLFSPEGYPPPIVEHALEREEALARYGRLRR